MTDSAATRNSPPTISVKLAQPCGDRSGGKSTYLVNQCAASAVRTGFEQQGGSPVREVREVLEFLSLLGRPSYARAYALCEWCCNVSGPFINRDRNSSTSRTSRTPWTTVPSFIQPSCCRDLFAQTEIRLRVDDLSLVLQLPAAIVGVRIAHWRIATALHAVRYRSPVLPLRQPIGCLFPWH